MPTGRVFAGSQVGVTITGTNIPTVYTDATAFSGSSNGIIFVGVQTGSTLPRAVRVTTTGAIQAAVVGAVTISPTYAIGNTTIAATGTGVLLMGKQSGATTARGIVLTTTGDIQGVQLVATVSTISFVSAGTVNAVVTGTVTSVPNGTQSVSVVNTPIVTATISNNPLVITATAALSVSGGGGGVQYSQGDTSIGATGTGTIFFGINSTTVRGVKVAADGTVFVSGGGGGTQYTQDTTVGDNTKTGTLILGVIGTTVRALGINTTGGITYVDNIGNVSTGTVTALPSGTQNVIVVGTPVVTATVSNNPLVCTAANVTIASITTGTVSIAGVVGTVSTVSTVLGTIAISGSMSVINTPTVTIGGTANAYLLAGTARVGSVAITAMQTGWQAYVVATTSAAAGVIVKTSGAHTLCVTDVLVSVSGPMQVSLCSETTAMATVYLAANGGFLIDSINPIVCTSAQSLRVVCGSSGSCAVFALGYTVT